eukprot:jgi/Mesvir1/24502/Mv21850-RA.1
MAQALACKATVVVDRHSLVSSARSSAHPQAQAPFRASAQGAVAQPAFFNGMRRAAGEVLALPVSRNVTQKHNPKSASTTVVAAAVTAIPQQKIRIKLRSYATRTIEAACTKILEAAVATDATAIGPVPLPTKRRVYCTLRSPHVNKNSMEHFEIRTHRRIIDLENPSAQTIDALMQLDLPAGVDVEVKLS